MPELKLLIDVKKIIRISLMVSFIRIFNYCI